MNAPIQHKFEVGMRVEMTLEALRKNLQGRKNYRTGTLIAIQTAPEGNYLRIRRDGEKTIDTYLPDFWQPIPTKLRESHGS